MDGNLAQNYAAAFDGHLPFGERPALIIVDAVMAYFDPASPLYAGVEAALASIERLVTAARTATIPVIFTRVVYEPGGADGGLFYRKIPVLNVFDAGSPLGAFPPSLQPASGDIIITKQYASSFFGTRPGRDPDRAQGRYAARRRIFDFGLRARNRA